MHQIWGKPKHTHPHTQTKREEIRGYLSTGRQELCAQYCSSKKKRLRDTFGPPSKHKIPITINKKKRNQILWEIRILKYLFRWNGIYMYIYTQKIIKQNIVTKKERGVGVRHKRNKPEIERLEIRERENVLVRRWGWFDARRWEMGERGGGSVAATVWGLRREGWKVGFLLIWWYFLYCLLISSIF